ncbi:hypothetical protein CYMTET_29576, partial [Cymbomonas tetramitiformis]
ELAPPALSGVHCLVRPCLHPSVSSCISKGVSAALWPEVQEDSEDNIRTAVDQVGRLRELLGAKEPSREVPLKRREQLEAMVDEVYAWLDRVLAKTRPRGSTTSSSNPLFHPLRKNPSVYVHSSGAFVAANVAYRSVCGTVPDLMYQIDAKVAVHQNLMAELGVVEQPVGVHLLSMLHKLDGQTPSQETAESCVLVLRQVAQDSSLINTKFLNELLVPDSEFGLHPLPRVVVNDAPWLLPRVAAGKLRIAWRGLGELRALTSKLRMRRLSEALDEQLEHGKMGSDGREHPELSALLSTISARVTSPEGAEAASSLRHRLLCLLDAQLEELRQEQASGDVPAASLPEWDVAHFCRRLDGLGTRVVVVERIVSRFEYLEALSVRPACSAADPADASSIATWRKQMRRRDVTNPKARCQSQLLLCREDRTLYIGQELLENMPAVVYAKLADVINTELGAPLSERQVRVLGSLLMCSTEDQMAATMHHMECGAAADQPHQSPSSSPTKAPPVRLLIPTRLLDDEGEGSCHVGQQLPEDAQERLVRGLPDFSILRKGQWVAWQCGGDPVEEAEETCAPSALRPEVPLTEPTRASLPAPSDNSIRDTDSAADPAESGATPVDGTGLRGKPQLALAEVTKVYAAAGLVVLKTGDAEERLMHWRELWWEGRDANVENQTAVPEEEGGLEEEDDGEDDVEGVYRAGIVDEEDPLTREGETDGQDGEGAASAANGVVSEESQAAEKKFDLDGQIRSINAEVNAYEREMQTEREKKLRQAERDLKQEQRENMRKFMKKLLLKWHPDKLRQQFSTSGQTVGEDMEMFVTEIAQEINRINERFE